MVDAIKSTSSAIQLEYYGPVTNSISTTSTNNHYYYAGDKVRAVLTFNKSNDLLISSPSDLDDLDLLLVKWDIIQGITIIDCSVSSANNEIIEAEIPSNGEYYFIIYARHIADVTKPPVAALEYMRYR